MCFATVAARSRASGFTLIELMIVVGVIAILSAIAIPMYQTYIMRGKIVDGTSKLGDLRTQLEKFFMDNRDYRNGAACGVDPIILVYNADPATNFQYACAPGATTYTLTATGMAARGMNLFVYTVNQDNLKTTTSVPVALGWSGAPKNCWIIKTDGSC